MRRRLIIAGVAGLVVLGMSFRIDWSTLFLRTVVRAMTFNWIPIHLKDGRTLYLDLYDGEMLNNVIPEPAPNGQLGTVGRWEQQLRGSPKEEVAWPVWLTPYPGAQESNTMPPGTWFAVSMTERRGTVERAYRTPDPATKVVEYYRRVLQQAGISVTGETHDPYGLSGIHGESSDHKRKVDVRTAAGRYSITYLAIEFGHFTPPPPAPRLDLSLASVDEAGKFVRLRNKVDGEILRLPFHCLTSEDELTKMHHVRAARRPDFLPPYPGGSEILPPADDPRQINIAFQSGDPPATIAEFYKRRALAGGFKLEDESSGVESGRPVAGFRAVAPDGGRLIFAAHQTDAITYAQAIYFKRR